MNDLSIFNDIAQKNAWGSAESISGPGSTLSATVSLRKGLLEVLKQLKIESLVDAPCGDMHWMRHLGYQFDKYVGIDMVPAVIASLHDRPAPSGYHFQVGNIVSDVLPVADALLCRDCLVHLPFKEIHEAMRLWKLAGFRYIMTTTFPRHTENVDCRPGGWRALNLQAAPFNWPAPDIIVPDNDGLGAPFDDKCLGVWRW